MSNMSKKQWSSSIPMCKTYPLICIHESNASRTVLYSLFYARAVYVLCLLCTLLFSYNHLIPVPSPSMNLHVLAHHGNHEIEQTDSLNEGKTQNSVREELSSHAWVAGNGHQESCEHHADTDSGTTETDGC
jgi:hypothetical protein